jgi:tetratricopeptide (TPR) repeat protein
VSNIGDMLSKQGRWAETLPLFQRAVAGTERTRGRNHPDMILYLGNLADALNSLGRYPEALASAEQAVEVSSRIDNMRFRCFALAELSLVELRLGNVDGAVEAGARGEAACSPSLGREDLQCVVAITQHGSALLAAGRTPEALARFEEALATLQKKLGDKADDLEPPLQGMGRARLALGQAQLAVAPLERAIALRDGGHEPRELRGVGFLLAQALWQSHGDKARARKLAQASRDALAKLGFADDVAEIDRWLAAHRLRSP